ncbi:cytochrome P450 [Phascolomyces articulosus]|uniref:Cytochrome P450 n=1 Tax=Phascolomyces articulosus TaxID=60185 RepID=A0AAD5PB73_9FUNG|nr:cytochrome P450 [Phascolomyces articulosus]
MVARGSASVFIGQELCQNGQVINILQTMTTDLGAFHPRYNPTWLTGFPWIMKLRMRVIGNYSPQVVQCRRILLEALTPEIDKRRSCASNNDLNWQRPDDMLQELVENATPPPGQDVYTFIMNQLLFLTFASIHTTTENGTIVLYRLLQNPDVLNELLEEQNDVLRQEVFTTIDPDKQQNGGNPSHVFTADRIKKMTKLDSVCREALRLRSQFYELAHTNVTNQNIVLSNGTVIPPDGDVLINFWHNHHNKKEGKYNDVDSKHIDVNEYDDLAEFKPFRYVNTGYPSTKVGDDYLVFGEGKHACPGRWFAMQEIKTIVSVLIRDYDVRAASDIVFPIGSPGLPFGKVTIVKRNIQ